MTSVSWRGVIGSLFPPRCFLTALEVTSAATSFMLLCFSLTSWHRNLSLLYQVLAELKLAENSWIIGFRDRWDLFNSIFFFFLWLAYNRTCEAVTYFIFTQQIMHLVWNRSFPSPKWSMTFHLEYIMCFPYVQTDTCYQYQSRKAVLDDNVLWKCLPGECMRAGRWFTNPVTETELRGGVLSTVGALIFWLRIQNLRPPMLEGAVVSEVQSAQTLWTRAQTCFSVWKILDFSFSKAHRRWVLSTCLCRGDDFVLDSGLRSVYSFELHHPHPGPAHHECLSQTAVDWCCRTVLGISHDSPDVWGCDGVTLAEHQVLTKAAPSSAGQGREDTTKGFWIRVRAGRDHSATAMGATHLN